MKLYKSSVKRVPVPSGVKTVIDNVDYYKNGANVDLVKATAFVAEEDHGEEVEVVS